VCARLSPPPASALSLSLHWSPYLHIPLSSGFIGDCTPIVQIPYYHEMTFIYPLATHHGRRVTLSVFIRIMFVHSWNREYLVSSQFSSKYRTKLQSNPLGISPDIPRYLCHELP
jgi:hypothetical protein